MIQILRLVFCAKYDPGDKYIAMATEMARIFDLETGKFAFSLSGSLSPAVMVDYIPITAFKWRPQSNHIKTI